MSTPSRKPSVKIIHGKATTTSLIVAKSFGKQHNNVLRAINELECTPEFAALNFERGEYTDAQNQKRPMFTITRKGFTFLACKFTGKEAAQWTEKFIEAFDQLEQHALEKAATKRLPKHVLSKVEGPAAPKPALPAPRDVIGSELQSSIDKRAFVLSHAVYDEFRKRMQNDVMVKGGHTKPEDWQPEETRREALQEIEVAAHMMEAHANVLRNRGRRLAKAVEQDYDEAVKKFRPPK